MEKALGALCCGKDIAVIIGPRVFQCGDRSAVGEALGTLAGLPNVNFIPLYFGANVRGALEMGAFPGVEPGPGARPEKGRGIGGGRRGEPGGRKSIYLVGDVPFFERPDCDFLIAQDIYLPRFKVDAFLPAASFAEAGGTLVNIEGRVQEIIAVEHPPEGAVTGFMRPDWRIFSDLARTIGADGMNYASHRDVLKEIRAAVPGFPAEADRQPRRMKPLGGSPSLLVEAAETGGDGYLLVAEPGGYRHRGIDIMSKVGGLKELGLEEGFRMNPEDLETLGFQAGDRILVSVEGVGRGAAGPVRADAECPKGAVYFTRPVVLGGLEHRRDLAPLFGLERNPVRASITREKA